MYTNIDNYIMSWGISRLILQGAGDQNETKTILLLTVLLLDTVNSHINTLV